MIRNIHCLGEIACRATLFVLGRSENLHILKK